jgi:Flp pilus assembly pilin Flp
MNIVTYLRSLAHLDEGQDLLEYALLVALIAIVAVSAVTLAGTSVSNVFKTVAGQIPS